MGAKKSKAANLGNEDDPVLSYRTTLKLYHMNELKRYLKMTGNNAKSSLQHIVVRFELSPKLGNEMRRLLLGDQCISVEKLSVRNQVPVQLVSFREDLRARIIRSICEIASQSKTIIDLDLKGFFVGGKLDIPKETPQMDLKGSTLKAMVDALIEAKNAQKDSNNATGVPIGLRFLNLANNNVTSTGQLSRLAGIELKKLFQAPGAIKKLDLSSNDIDFTCAMHCFGELRSGLIGVDELDISNNQLCGEFDEWGYWYPNPIGPASIRDMLKMNGTTLKILKLVNIGLEKSGAEKLAMALEKPTCPLHTIDVSYNPLGDEGFEHLIGAVDQMKELEDKTLKTTVFEELESNINLKKMICRGIGITIKSCEALVDMFVERARDETGELCVDITENTVGEEAFELCDMFKPGKYKYKTIIARKSQALDERVENAQYINDDSKNVTIVIPPESKEDITSESGSGSLLPNEAKTEGKGDEQPYTTGNDDEDRASDHNIDNKDGWATATDDLNRTIHYHKKYRKMFYSIAAHRVGNDYLANTIEAGTKKLDNIERREKYERDKKAAEEAAALKKLVEERKRLIEEARQKELERIEKEKQEKKKNRSSFWSRKSKKKQQNEKEDNNTKKLEEEKKDEGEEETKKDKATKKKSRKSRRK